MPYVINPVEEDRCLFVRHEGEVSIHDVGESLRRAGGVLSGKGWSRLLVDATGVTKRPSLIEVYLSANQLLSALPRSTRIAVVFRSDKKGEARFVENMIFNVSARMAAFAEVDKARVWIRQEETPGDD
jgi:hypothetical protein